MGLLLCSPGDRRTRREVGRNVRVLQMGVGAVGEMNARVIAREPAVEAIDLADIDESRLR